MSRKNILYNQPLEGEIGFSRAVRIGNFIAVSGTAPIAQNLTVHCPGDVYAQTKRCLEIVKDVVEQAGGRLDNVVRTRILLRDIGSWKDAARAHGEYFANVKLACTFVEVSGFVNPEWLVEVEADAILAD
jgi:enamine deaminase RidA (YjgF/YER057c/UK114 family)